MRKTIHCTISGKVQGVFFRAFTRELARDLHLTGWVRNNSNGTVELVAQGDDEKLTKLKNKLQQGPPSARVGSVDCEQLDDAETYQEFKLRY